MSNSIFKFIQINKKHLLYKNISRLDTNCCEIVKGGKSVKIRLREQFGDGLVFSSLIRRQESR